MLPELVQLGGAMDRLAVIALIRDRILDERRLFGLPLSAGEAPGAVNSLEAGKAHRGARDQTMLRARSGPASLLASTASASTWTPV